MNAYQKVSRRLNFFERITNATYSQLFLTWISINLVCTLLYFVLATSHPNHAPTLLSDMEPATRLFNSLYFSVITATSLGYGDIIPLGFSKVITMIESIVTLMIFAVFVTKLVTRKQDAALQEVHKMTFEGIFYHIRQGLFVVRKDFDHLMHITEQKSDFSDRDWETLTTAYLQAQSLIEEIPELYEGQVHDLYTIDPKRERLLFEAIHRTLERIDKMIASFEASGIEWMSHQDSMEELHSLMHIVDDIMPLWRERSPYHRVTEFDDIFSLGSQLHERIKGALANKK